MVNAELGQAITGPNPRSTRAGRPSGGLGGLRECLEDPHVISFFRAPLHADAERVAAELGRLHHLVVGPRGRLEPVTEPGDRLMVRTRHADLLSEQPAKLARRLDPHIVEAHPGPVRGVPVVPHSIGEMLQRDWQAWAALSKTTMARANSQIWC